MVQNNAPHTELELGYRFHLGGRVGGIGYPGLGVVLHAAPTRHYFDPVAVHLAVVSRAQGGEAVEHLAVHHEWPGRERYRVCAGRIRLVDRAENVVQAFTYGGNMTIYRADDYTTLTIASPAPILEMIYQGQPESLSMRLAAECEHLLAERRAYWSQHAAPRAFEARLVHAGPLPLYRACIVELCRRFAARSYGGDSLAQRFARLLHGEEASFGGQTGQAPPLAEIV